MVMSVVIALVALGCAGEDKIVEVEKIVTVVVEKEVPVVVEKEVIKEVEVQMGGPQGHIIFNTTGIPAPSGWTSKSGGVAYWITLMNVMETLLHGGKDSFGNQLYLPNVIESWKHSSDGTTTDFTVKKGNYFHQGFGEVTAEDVVYSSNEGDPRCASQKSKDEANPVRHSGLPDGDYGCWELIDKYTVRQPWTGGHPGARGMFEITTDAYPWGVYSKKAYDDKGYEWVRDNVIGSGPYEYEVMDSDKCWTMVARQDGLEDEHVPYVERWSVCLIPEYATMLALFEAGQAHIGWIEGDDINRLLSTQPWKHAPNGGKGGHNWSWMGNYWETVHPISGEPLERIHRDNNPWICAPGPDPLKPEESDCNKVAKKFRNAMFMAIPRKDIVDSFYGGGATILSPIANLDDFIIKKYGDIWGHPNNPEGAKALFEEWKADYKAMGKNPDEITVHAWAGTGSGVRVVATEALLTHWADVFGIDWAIDTTPQKGWATAAWGGREGWRLVMDASPTYRGIQMRWDSEDWYTARSAPMGSNHGMELLMHSQVIAGKNAAWDDPVEQERLTVMDRDYLFDQGIHTGSVEGQHGTLYDSSYIQSWTDRHAGVPWWMWDPEYVTLTGKE